MVRLRGMLDFEKTRRVTPGVFATLQVFGLSHGSVFC